MVLSNYPKNYFHQIVYLTYVAMLLALTPCRSAAEFLQCSQNARSATFRASAQLQLHYLHTNQSESQKVAPKLSISDLEEPNAFALPSGTVLVSSELLASLLSSSEEAFVLAHELGHLRASPGHLRAQVRGLLPASSSSLGLEFLRDEEDADLFAVKLLARTHNDPGTALTVLSRLNYMTSSILVTSRISKLEKVLISANGLNQQPDLSN